MACRRGAAHGSGSPSQLGVQMELGRARLLRARPGLGETGQLRDKIKGKRNGQPWKVGPKTKNQENGLQKCFFEF
jgi:hypothetical protein